MSCPPIGNLRQLLLPSHVQRAIKGDSVHASPLLSELTSESLYEIGYGHVPRKDAVLLERAGICPGCTYR